MNDKNLRKWIITYLIKEGMRYDSTRFYITDDYIKLGRRSKVAIRVGEFAAGSIASLDTFYLVARDNASTSGQFCVCARFKSIAEAVGFVGRSKLRNSEIVMYNLINHGHVTGHHSKIPESAFDT